MDILLLHTETLLSNFEQKMMQLEEMVLFGIEQESKLKRLPFVQKPICV